MSLKKKFILTFCLAMIAHIVLYTGFYYMANTRNELILRNKEFTNLPVDKDVLFLGDSHVERSIDIRKLGNRFFSMAYYGENNVMNYYRMKYYFENNLPKPKYIILPCDIVTFAKGYNLYRTNSFFYYNFIPYKDLQNFESKTLASSYNFFKMKLFPYSEWQYGLNLANPNREAIGKEKFSDKTEEEQSKNAENFLQNELMCKGNSKNLYSNTALTYLQKTIDLCKEKGVKLIFIKYPLTKNLFNEVKYHVDSTYIDDRPSDKLIQKQNIPLLNFERLFENKSELFFDCHHLNIDGKETFTPILKLKLDSLLNVY